MHNGGFKRGVPGLLSKGFTIVELLIVIVIIAILAVIIIISFNGITKKAEYTSIAVTVKQYAKAFDMYRIENGINPISSGTGTVGFCVGEGYPNLDADPEGDCINDADYALFTFNEDSAFNDKIRPYIPTLPNIQKEGFVAGGHNYNGLNYAFDPNIYLDGVSQPRSFLFYYLKGQNQDCQYPVVRYSGTVTAGLPRDYVFSTTNTHPWTYVNAHATACVIILE